TFAEGTALTLDKLSSYSGGFDVLFVCTAAVEPIITQQNMVTLLNGEPVEEKLVIDLAVPNNVDETVVATTAFPYVAVEHLRALAEENMAFRSQEIQRAQVLLRKHLADLENEYRQRLLERALQHLPVEIKAVKQRAFDQVFAKEIEGLDPAARELMDRMMTYMEKKCIGIPMKAAREALIG
ncbi:MAG: glutamyl-tRNA reductase, partial [Bacteroidota bacterium]